MGLMGLLQIPKYDFFNNFITFGQPIFTKLNNLEIIACSDSKPIVVCKKSKDKIDPMPKTLKKRASILAGLEFVDWVTWFSEDNPLTLLEKIKPDILVKGGDYQLNQVVGGDLVEKYGGKVATVDLQEDCSGTSIIEKIKSS